MKRLSQELIQYVHIIFDWNGTLLSDVQVVLNILNSNLARHSLPAISYEAFRDRFRFPIKEYYKELGMEDQHYDSFNQHYHRLYNETYKSAELYDGALDLLSELSKQGKVVSILSASEEGHLREAVDHFGVSQHVDHIYGLSNFVALGKAARGLELMAHVSSVPQEQTIIIGDTLYDAEVGKTLGIDVLLLADGHQSMKQLAAAEAHCKVLPSRFF